MSYPGFYPVILATFRFLKRRFGKRALEEYWRRLVEEYYAKEIESIRDKGLEGWKEFWEGYYSREKGIQFQSREEEDSFLIEIIRCPAYYWLEKFGRDIPSWYCEHCRVTMGRMAELAGLHFTLEGGGGRCSQKVLRDAGSE